MVVLTGPSADESPHFEPVVSRPHLRPSCGAPAQARSRRRSALPPQTALARDAEIW